MAESRTTRRPVARSAAAAVTLAVLLAAGFVARAYAADDPTSGYRTARATIGTVDQRLAFTGTVQRVAQQTVTFAVSGQVASVAAVVGQSVTKGQQLASLDTADLEDAVVQAKASLARAKATLESDQSGTSTTTSSSPQRGTTALSALPAALMASTPTATPAPTPTSKKSTPGQGAAGSVSKAKGAVSAALAKVPAAQQAASAALAAADDTCADVLGATEPTPTGTPPGTSTTSPAPDPTTTIASHPSAPASTAADAAALASCLKAMRTAQAALHAVTAAQDSVASAQDRLATAQQAWEQALAKQAKAVAQSSTGRTRTGGPTGSTAQTGTGGAGNTPNSGTGSQSRTGSRSGSTDSASRIASDQAAVAQAELALKQAQTALRQAKLRAPIAGTVAAINLVAGESAGSNGITIIGSGGATVTVEVPVASIPKVAVGQEADVTPPGAIAVVKGTVQEVGLLPAETTSSSAATYPVVVLVPEATATLASGARAPVSILVGTSAGVVTVPNSAITPASTTSAFVTVVKGAVATRTAITLGTVGPTRTQVSKGLSAGDTVLLADASEAIPTSTNQNRLLGGFTGEAFGGSGFGGGGFSGEGIRPGGTGFARN